MFEVVIIILLLAAAGVAIYFANKATGPEEVVEETPTPIPAPEPVEPPVVEDLAPVPGRETP